MRRFTDIFIIVVLLIIGSSLKAYTSNIKHNNLNDKIQNFESDILVNNVIDDTYAKQKVYIKQVDENHAGRIARDVSSAIERLVDTAFTFTNELFYKALK